MLTFLVNILVCDLQVCLEGQISRKSAMKSLSEGRSPSGDQIPWKFCEQFQDNVFPSLSGARIVRIAVHPSAVRLGYGSAAVDLLTRYAFLFFTPTRGYGCCGL
jgi:N-acetyltransferase 10